MHVRAHGHLIVRSSLRKCFCARGNTCAQLHVGARLSCTPRVVQPCVTSRHNVQGVTPLAGLTRDVLGPHAKTVTDAALALDLMTQYGTPAFRGKAPAGGYTSQLGKTTLEGKRIGLYGPGWKDVPLTEEIQALYDSAKEELAALGATLVDDPFAGTGFDALSPNEGYDATGYESVAYDFYTYLLDFGITGFDEFEAKVGISVFDPSTPVAGRAFSLPEPYGSIFNASLENPSVKPNLVPFFELRSDYTRIIAQTFARQRLDALVFPHDITTLPLMDSNNNITGTTISDVNIGGFPLVTVPSTRNAGPPEAPGPSPFSLLFVGPMFSEALLLALAYDYEQATHLRVVPELALTHCYGVCSTS